MISFSEPFVTTRSSPAYGERFGILDELKKGLPLEEKAIQERLDKLLQYD